MKAQIFIFAIFAVIAFTEEQDVSNLLKNQRVVKKQIDCVLDRGNCNAIGRQIKGLLPEAVHNNCRRCTPREAAQAQQIINFMRKNYPHEWNLILRRYAGARH